MKAAIRHMMRNRRRTILTLLAVLIPVYFLVMMFGFVNSMMQDMFESSTRFDTGHMQIHAEETRATGSAMPLIRNTEDALAALASVDGIEWSTVRLDLPALASVGDRTRTVYVRGVVPEEIEPVSNMADRVVDGSASMGSRVHGTRHCWIGQPPRCALHFPWDTRSKTGWSSCRLSPAT